MNMSLMAALLLLAAAFFDYSTATAAHTASSCTIVAGTVLGSQCTRATCTLGNRVCESSAECCDLCGSTRDCTAWTFEPSGSCYLKNSTEHWE